MRALLLILLLANALFFVWSAGYFGDAGDGREPERLAAQLRPEAIRLLPARPAGTRVCRRLEGLGPVGGERAAALRAFAGQHATLSLELLSQPAPAAFWLIVPGYPSLAAAQKRQGELRATFAEAQAIADAENGPFVVKLAEFASRAAADERAGGVDLRGGKPAPRVIERAGAGEVAAARIDAPAAEHSALDALQGWVAAQQGVTLVDCPGS